MTALRASHRVRSFWAFVSLGATLAVVALSGSPAIAQAPPAGAKVFGSCVEHIPSGASKPELSETFAERGFAGYAVDLEVTVTHGKGETVLPDGFNVQRGSEASLALSQAGFVIPEADGGSAPSITRKEEGEKATTTLVIPILLSPDGPGRHELTLPPLPIAVVRASGEQVTVCTQPHPVTALDPTGNEQDPQVRQNPDPRPQREEWVLLKRITFGVALGILAGILLAWLLYRYAKRPKPAPVEERRHPWEVALEELTALRASPLLAEARSDELYDQVSDTIRKYLGARYGFDGLETTTDEMRGMLKRVRPKIRNLGDIATFLGDCDLVKFANMVPTEADCLNALAQGEAIIMATTPRTPDPKRRRKKKGKPGSRPPPGPTDVWPAAGPDAPSTEGPSDATATDATATDATATDVTTRQGSAAPPKPADSDGESRPDRGVDG